jgi:uncharacterized damage-inducible protein DinB
MNVVEYIQRQFDALRRQTNATVADLTDEQLNWAPPGMANKIGVTLLHAVAGEDMMVQTWLQGKLTLWELQDWGDRIGLKTPPGGPGNWDEANSVHLKLASLMAYQEAVCEKTSAYLSALTPEELDRTVKLFNGDHPAADVLVLAENHILGHLGEIAALKGVQGVKGLPF